MDAYLESQNITLLGAAFYAFVGLVVYRLAPLMLKLIINREVAHKKFLALASATYFVSLLLPSPLVHGQNTNFTTHFVGGGIFTGFLWLFIKLNLKLKPNAYIELISLYFLVSGLGVANELFEFFGNGVGFMRIPSNDTWWDLFANTLGAGTFWLIYRLYTFCKS